MSADLAPNDACAATFVHAGVLRSPEQILFGSGVIDQLTTVTLRYGDRVLACCDPYLATTPAWAATHAALLGAGAQVHVLSDVVAELPVASVEEAARASSGFRADVIIGFGGGSALDLAKLVALLHTHGASLRKYYGENAVPGPVLPIIAVPTTAGTGSEVTPVAVVSDPDRELKVGISSPYLIPSVALVDPELTHGAPASVTAHAGIDAFVHAVESFTAANRSPAWGEALPVFVGRNSLSTPLAREAISLIGASLSRAVHGADDAAARAGTARGSLLAGLAFATAGTHLSHAIQYPVGALTGTPHGLGTGLLLPYVLQACLPAIEPQLEEIAGLLGADSATPAGPAQAAVEWIAALVTEIGLPSSLSEIGITASQLPRIAELAGGVSRLVQNAPISPTPDLLAAIVTAAWNGDRASLSSSARTLP